MFRMRTVAWLASTALAATTFVALPAAGEGPDGSSPAVAKAARYTKQTLHFKVRVGAPGTEKTCDIVGDLYLPKGASSKKRVPAVLATNGFGGSKDDQAKWAPLLTGRGYALLSYSGLGFGGSTCQVTLDDVEHDGRAASQLVSYLGGAKGIAYRDAKHTQPAPRLKVVARDRRDQTGRRSRNDPKVGMLGGSYGGAVQFAAASIDHRIDAIVPMITWNDLSYSLGPNNTGQRGVSSREAGAVKLFWGLGFSGLGMVQGLLNAPDDPGRLLPCPNFTAIVCPALVTGAVLGTFLPTSVNQLRAISPVSHVAKIRTPTLLMQGQYDTLFNLNESLANYRILRKQGTPVKLVWQRWGHSGDPAPGEMGAVLSVKRDYSVARTVAWLDRYVKGRKVDTGPRFAWFRDWVRYSGNAKPAYATSKRVAVGKAQQWHLSGKELVRSRAAVRSGTQMMTTPVAGLPTSFDQLDMVSYIGNMPAALPEIDLPGTAVSWRSPVLAQHVTVVGTPKLDLRVDAPLSLPGQLVLFAKLYDVAPSGKATLLRNLIAPVRIADAKRPIAITMPGLVHRFAKGHRIELRVTGGSTNYRGNLLPQPVTISTGGSGQTLTLPVVR
ncbi:alpha/beta fold hydrolase [Nocardioides daejeonensis]|uniref:alpha/beta fold hydrolase n=1 Tax=Nocardioides daejeonensis TaxID=1046556 RepID=UPI001951234A|nr:alpha/beta fold hydrolase [Nocardioides daejeonensis]